MIPRNPATNVQSFNGQSLSRSFWLHNDSICLLLYTHTQVSLHGMYGPDEFTLCA